MENRGIPTGSSGSNNILNIKKSFYEILKLPEGRILPIQYPMIN